MVFCSLRRTKANIKSIETAKKEMLMMRSLRSADSVSVASSCHIGLMSIDMFICCRTSCVLLSLTVSWSLIGLEFMLFAMICGL